MFSPLGQEKWKPESSKLAKIKGQIILEEAEKSKNKAGFVLDYIKNKLEKEDTSHLHSTKHYKLPKEKLQISEEYKEKYTKIQTKARFYMKAQEHKMRAQEREHIVNLQEHGRMPELDEMSKPVNQRLTPTESLVHNLSDRRDIIPELQNVIHPQSFHIHPDVRENEEFLYRYEVDDDKNIDEANPTFIQQSQVASNKNELYQRSQQDKYFYDFNDNKVQREYRNKLETNEF